MKWCFLAAILLATVAGRAAEMREIPALAAIFEKAGASGTFVMLDPKTGALVGHDAARAAKRFIPASTFKIPNTLIGLETSAVKSVDEVLPYGGKPQMLPEWEKDMGLREALPISAVPIYKELARRVGLPRMREWLVKLDYGNCETGDKVDQFWLVGPLEISAIEQVRFLARLAAGDLPVDPENVAAVAAITTLEKTPDATLHAKTGWCMDAEPQIGWWVGWVERDGEAYPFALNMDMPEGIDPKVRLEIGRACLRELGVW